MGFVLPLTMSVTDCSGSSASEWSSLVWVTPAEGSPWYSVVDDRLRKTGVLAAPLHKAAILAIYLKESALFRLCLYQTCLLQG